MTSIREGYNSIDSKAPKELSDKAHNPILITIDCDPETLLISDYGQLFMIQDINELLDEYYAILYDVFEKFVPKSTIKPSKNPMSFNKSLGNLKNDQNLQYTKLCAARKIDENADSTPYMTEQIKNMKARKKKHIKISFT